MNIVTCDFETYYDNEYSLRKLTTEEYVRDPRFEAILLSVKIGDNPVRLYEGENITKAVKAIPWDRVALLCHNTAFDGFILNERYGVQPKLYLDTLSMARPWHHHDVGGALAKLVAHYGITIDGRTKGHEVVMAQGKHYDDFTPDELAAYKRYCGDDTELTYRLFYRLMERMPRFELLRIDSVLRTFIVPQLALSREALQANLEDTIARKEALLDKVTQIAGRDALSSNRKFIGVLEQLGGYVPAEMFGSPEEYRDYVANMQARGIQYKFTIPTKLRPATATEQKKGITGDVRVWAISKKDEEFIALAEGDDEELAAVCEARMGVKSTIGETRAARLLGMEARGLFPVPLIYYAAHTGRLGGAEKTNPQNFKKPTQVSANDVGFTCVTPAGITKLLKIEDDAAITPKGSFPVRKVTTLTARHGIIAPPGHVIVVADASQIEARLVAWNAEQENLVTGFRNKEDIYSDFASTVYGYACNKKDNPTERFVGKTCLAEGTLILTENGLVPIEEITLQDRVWDGVEWVRHDGVAYMGEKDVITYQGVTATEDHGVFTDQGVLPLGVAASRLANLITSGVGWQEVRVSADLLGGDSTPEEEHLRVRRVYELWREEMDTQGQLTPGEVEGVPVLLADEISTFSGDWAALRRDQIPVYFAGRSCVSLVRGAWDQVPVPVTDGVHPMGDATSPTQGLSRSGDRQGGQQRTLRAGESTAGNAGGSGTQPPQHRNDPVEGGDHTTRRVSNPILRFLDIQASNEAEVDRGGDSRKVRVYDILNAGPRRRYTADGKLVFNCILGLGYGMGPPKLQSTLAVGQGGISVVVDDDEAKRFVQIYRREKYPMIPALWRQAGVALEAIMAGEEMSFGIRDLLRTCDDGIILPNGMLIQYPKLRRDEESNDLFYWGKKEGRYQWVKIYGGKCVDGDSLVLTEIGWKPLRDIGSERVHDGVEFVEHGGKMFNGIKQCVTVDGVMMTPDHKVLTDEGWKTALEKPKPLRPDLRDVDCAATEPLGRQEDALGVSVCMREGMYQGRGGRNQGSKTRRDAELWMRDRCVNSAEKSDTWDEQASGLRSVEKHGGSLHATLTSCMEKLRRARDNSLRGVAGIVRNFLEGHGWFLPARALAGQNGQQQGVLAGELRMGFVSPEREEPAKQFARGPSSPIQNYGDSVVHPVLPVREGLTAGEVEVYDIVNCGPRNRYVVLGSEGPFVVHNCTENFTQALAGIIVGEAWVRINSIYMKEYMRTKAPICMQVHDELLAVVPENEAKDFLDLMIAEMRRPPRWAYDLPLDAEGDIGLCYADAK